MHSEIVLAITVATRKFFWCTRIRLLEIEGSVTIRLLRLLSISAHVFLLYIRETIWVPRYHVVDNISRCTFKAQPVGRKFQRLASESLSYLNQSLKGKTAAQQWHRVTHRMLSDLQHRCIRRTAPEEWNLASSMNHADVTRAEFVRTFRSADFNGLDLIKRLETEQKRDSVRECWKRLPPSSAAEDSEHDVWLQHFTDLYGFRGCNPHNTGVFLLSPWEFLMHWECKRLPSPASSALSKWVNKAAAKFEPDTTMESKDLLFFPDLPGDIQLRNRWYMTKRTRPMIPAPSKSPMPDRQRTKELKARIFSVYHACGSAMICIAPRIDIVGTGFILVRLDLSAALKTSY